MTDPRKPITQAPPALDLDDDWDVASRPAPLAPAPVPTGVAPRSAVGPGSPRAHLLRAGESAPPPLPASFSSPRPPPPDGGVHSAPTRPEAGRALDLDDPTANMDGFDTVTRSREVDPFLRTLVASARPVVPSDRAPAATAARGPLDDLKDRFAAGDYSGALVIADGILEQDPANLEVQRYAESCEEVLTQMLTARLSPLDQVVAVVMPPDQIRWLALDHRAGFLLSMIDGYSSLEMLLDVSGMRRIEALRVINALLDQKVIDLSPG